jgi:hypothetical protein
MQMYVYTQCMYQYLNECNYVHMSLCFYLFIYLFYFMLLYIYVYARIKHANMSMPLHATKYHHMLGPIPKRMF